jgi:hypothetical protein
MRRHVALSACLLVALMLLGFRSWISDHIWNLARFVELHHTRLSQSEVIRIAKAEVEKANIDVSPYEAPVAEYEHQGGDVVWWVTYTSKTHVIDGCFWVEVDDRTGAAKLGHCG